jgi:hypothetical protein
MRKDMQDMQDKEEISLKQRVVAISVFLCVLCGKKN